jgi:hypothetical protein
MRVEMTCGCGAKLEAESSYEGDVAKLTIAFHEAHWVCRNPSNGAAEVVQFEGATDAK